MGPFIYKVERINGDYAELIREDDNNEKMPVAIALLPDGIDEGDRVVWENFTYTIKE